MFLLNARVGDVVVSGAHQELSAAQRAGEEVIKSAGVTAPIDWDQIGKWRWQAKWSGDSMGAQAIINET